MTRVPTKEEDAALSLTLAVVASANSPLLLLDGAFNIVGASAAFSHAFGLAPDGGAGQSVFALGSGEWAVPELRSFLDVVATGGGPPDIAFDLVRGGTDLRHLIVHGERLQYLDLDQVRLLVAIADATEARAAESKAEELRKRNAMLVQEAQHRVANSLQIIASVLMQHARRTQSEETRNDLNAAHQRVMSVAALERHLATCGQDRVLIQPYLVKLCESIASSMIADHEQVSLDVVADGSAVEPNVSFSLGLITTELVINAIKYAFPEGRAGTIAVSYQGEQGGWVLKIADNGVGMPSALPGAGGLGTSIVQALAMQLGALVVIDREAIGTTVSVIRPAERAG